MIDHGPNAVCFDCGKTSREHPYPDTAECAFVGDRPSLAAAKAVLDELDRLGPRHRRDERLAVIAGAFEKAERAGQSAEEESEDA